MTLTPQQITGAIERHESELASIEQDIAAITADAAMGDKPAKIKFDELSIREVSIRKLIQAAKDKLPEAERAELTAKVNKEHNARVAARVAKADGFKAQSKALNDRKLLKSVETTVAARNESVSELIAAGFHGLAICGLAELRSDIKQKADELLKASKSDVEKEELREDEQAWEKAQIAWKFANGDYMSALTPPHAVSRVIGDCSDASDPVAVIESAKELDAVGKSRALYALLVRGWSIGPAYAKQPAPVTVQPVSHEIVQRTPTAKPDWMAA